MKTGENPDAILYDRKTGQSRSISEGLDASVDGLMAANLGDKHFLMLRNHGLLVTGQDIPAGEDVRTAGRVQAWVVGPGLRRAVVPST